MIDAKQNYDSFIPGYDYHQNDPIQEELVTCQNTNETASDHWHSCYCIDCYFAVLSTLGHALVIVDNYGYYCHMVPCYKKTSNTCATTVWCWIVDSCNTDIKLDRHERVSSITGILSFLHFFASFLNFHQIFLR